MIKRLRSIFHRSDRPLQTRLAVFFATAVTGAVVFTGFVGYVTTWQMVYRQLDDELVEVATLTSHWIAGDVESLGGINADALQAANATVAVVRSDNTIYRPSGNTPDLVVTAEEMAIARTQVGTSARQGQNTDGQIYRIVAVPFTDNGRYYALVLGQPLSSTVRIVTTLGWSLLIIGTGAVLVSAVVGTMVARSGMKPVRTLTDTVRHVTETDELALIEIDGVDEVADLAHSFNQMMRSLAASRDQHRQLIADASHELRTPLTALRTNVELLVADNQQGMLSAEARNEILHDVAAQLGEFTTLIGDLVHLSREDVVRPSPKPIDFMEVVERALERVKRRGPGLKFRVELQPFYMVGDAESLERAVTNLLDNAVKFSPPEGTVSVWLVGDRLIIADEGPGIAAADLPHVFDRFYRSATARATPGSGLGLSIVASTVRAHDGWVKAEAAPSGGAQFVVRLPGSQMPPETDIE